MDPNFIHLDWERTFEALMLVAVVSIIIERSLSVLFQNRIYIERIHRDGMKETIALVVSIAVCIAWKFDAMGMILLTETTTMLGYFVTGAVVAGGSKGSLKLFQDVFGLQSTAFKIRHSLQAAKAADEAERAGSEAEAAPTKATAEIAKGKATAALKKVKIAAVKAAADGRPVPTETIAVADAAVASATAAVDKKVD